MRPLTIEWISTAEQDYRAATQLWQKRDTTLASIVSFHCQQCVEKYLKARLQEADIAFPKTHNLTELLDLALPAEPLWSSFHASALGLTTYAVETRSPGDDVSPDEADKALAACKSFRQEIRRSLGLKLPPAKVREHRAKYTVNTKRRRS